LGTKQAIPAMRQAGGGSIINISSIAGLVGFGPSSGAYAASKGAVRLLTKSTATQYAKDGIRCNSVHPGFIDTPMTARSLSIPATREDRIRRTPLGRIGTPEDIAYGVLYLASDERRLSRGVSWSSTGATPRSERCQAVSRPRMIQASVLHDFYVQVLVRTGMPEADAHLAAAVRLEGALRLPAGLDALVVFQMCTFPCSMPC
jgi:hypothetical protein